MIENLTWRHILLLVIAIIILIWLINWLTSCKKKSKNVHSPHKTSDMRQHKISDSPKGMPISTEPQQQTLFILYYFYNPNCPHCVNFNPVWNQIYQKFKNIKSLSMRAINATKTENDNLTFYYNVTAFPTIILVTPDRNIEYSNRPRTAQELEKFVMSNIKSYQN